MSQPSTTIRVDDVKVATDKALLCVVDKRGDSGEIEIPLWLAEEKGIA